MTQEAPARGRDTREHDAAAVATADLVEALESGRWDVRQAAERKLSEIGPPAVPELLTALASGDGDLRWAAAKVLGEIAHPSAIEGLIAGLDDERAGVRWLAAEALAATGSLSVVPVLRRLLASPSSPWVMEGAHHVLRRLMTPVTEPVVHALEEHFASLAAPVAANEALKRIEQR
jgi:HEAT repeat protein